MSTISNKSVTGMLTKDDLERLNKLSSNTENNAKLKKQVMDQDAFMKILAAQLKYQDPLSPMKDQEFIGQMAQFNTLDSMNNLVKLGTMSNDSNSQILEQISSMNANITKLVENLTTEIKDDPATKEDESGTLSLNQISEQILAELKTLNKAITAYED